MHRFFIDPRDIDGPQANLAGPEAHHLRHVLRLTAGDEIELFDGSGAVYRATIKQMGKAIQLAITGQHTIAPSQPVLVIAQGLLKGKKMDFLIQKATELGVSGFLPFHSAYCAVPAVKDAKTSRWEKIIMEACKQCGRAIPLAVSDPLDFNGVLARGADYATKIIFWEKETTKHLHDLPDLSATPAIIALVGPEGGFSTEEINRATAAGFIPVSMGRLTLRAETASIAAMTLLQHLGDNL